MKREHKKNLVSLRRRLIQLILFCWIVPVVILFVFLVVSYRKSVITKLETLLTEDMRNNTVVTSVNLQEVIAAAKKVSYDQTIEKYWRKMSDGWLSKAEFYKEVLANLKGQFYTDRRFQTFAFYLKDERVPFCYSSKSGFSYSDYVSTYAVDLWNIFESDSSDAHVRVVKDKVFIVRNMYTIDDYTKFGSLVTELNLSEIFVGNSSELSYSLSYIVNEASGIVATKQDILMQEVEVLADQIISQYSGVDNDSYQRTEQGNTISYLYEMRCRDFHLGAVLISDKRVLYGELIRLYWLIGMLISILIPLVSFAVYFATKHVTHPAACLVEFAKKLEQGKIGITMEDQKMPNQEFAYLQETYNHMSREVKELFDYAYDEQLARKDAKIQALQAQINPHFLNNTLEMMNWQARMAGDIQVSKMIEALSTVLDYGMDRSNRRLISLSEELRCADAYYYIISMRFGQRVQIEKEVDRSLLQIKIPQLILQPLLENAVVHGVEAVKSGIIMLRIYHDEAIVYLQIQNSGVVMNQEDKDRIQQLLSGSSEGIKEGAGKHTSLGIRNVNERIKLIYGENFGLTITQQEPGITLATIQIPYHNSKIEEEVWNKREI